MLIQNKNKKYLTILSDGTLRLSVPEGTENAVTREYETKTGEKKIKWELVYNGIEGKITNIEFFDGDYGKQIQIDITDDGGESYTISVGTSQGFGKDIMKKLPLVNLDEKVKILPYSIENNNGKINRGVSIYQNEKKIKNNFWNEEDKQAINGIPVPEGDPANYSKNDWKIHFLKEENFLVEYTQKNIISKFKKSDDWEMEYPESTGPTAF